MSEAIEITFLRHGRSRADDEQVCEGRYDAPLTDVGRAQVQARAQQWQAAGVHFDLAIASPLQRAAESARIVAQTLAVPIETDPDWMERDNGPLAGLPFAEAEARYPKPAFRNPYEPFCGTGESEWDVACRAARGVQKVVQRGPGRYLVVAHGNVLNAALRGIAGVPPLPDSQGLRFALGDAGYVRMSYAPSAHVWTLYELCRNA
jgi:2,3-bisphosphoglycerate-dependent phosphoglycerate mutase